MVLSVPLLETSVGGYRLAWLQLYIVHLQHRQDAVQEMELKKKKKIQVAEFC